MFRLAHPFRRIAASHCRIHPQLLREELTNVPAYEIVSHRDPLDLLRRFAPTPLRTAVPLDFAGVTLETNDLSFFPTADRPATDADTQLPRCFWKIVRDVDIHYKPAEATIVMAGNLIVYSLGPACIIAADRERQELLGFIGVAVDARMFQDAIFPALVRLTEFVARPLGSASAHPAARVSIGDICNV
jgi:hypothetical protein